MRLSIVILAIVGLLSNPEKRSQQVYTVYTPFVASATNHYKGLAMGDMGHPEDRAALNVSWWYVWGWYTAEAGVVPMVREMQIPPTCEPYIMVGNEPDAPEPAGHPVAPQEAAGRVLAIEQACPNSRLIVGNVTQDGAAWLTDFLAAYDALAGREYAGGLGVHCYQWQIGICIANLTRLRALYAGEMWVTEFNDFSGDLAEFTRLLDYIGANFDRYAIFTNRQLAGPGFPHGPIVNDDGTLDARGLIYSER